MNVFLICALAAHVLWAIVPACLAHSKKRNPWLFLAIGLIVPLIAVIVLLCMGEKKEELPEEAEATEESEVFSLDEMEETAEIFEAEEPVEAEETAEPVEAEETAEPVEVPKKSKLPVVLSVLASVVLGAAVVVCLFFGVKAYLAELADPYEPIFDPNGQYGQNDITVRNDYSVSEADPTDETMRAVVAVDKDGNPAVTNGQLQVSYWVDFYNFMSSYGQYAAYFGLDPASPLNSQTSMTEGLTWEQFFLDSAVHSMSQNYALAQAAYADGYVPSEEDQADLDDATDPLIALRKAAEEGGYLTLEAYLQAEFGFNTVEEYMMDRYGFATMEEYIQESFGVGTSVQDYANYVKTFLAASNHYQAYSEELKNSATDEAVGAYYDEHAEEFEADRVLKVNNVTVRHILIQPEGEQDPTTGEYSDEAWEAAEEKANEIYELWQEDSTEDYFVELVKEYSTDGGSVENGGLYENFDSNDMVEEFSDWCFDQSRVFGDTGIVRTTYGFHIMFFVEQTEMQGWLEIAKEKMVQEQMTNHLDELCEQYPLSFDFDKIRIYDLISHAVANLAETVATEAEEETIG